MQHLDFQLDRECRVHEVEGGDGHLGQGALLLQNEDEITIHQ